MTNLPRVSALTVCAMIACCAAVASAEQSPLEIEWDRSLKAIYDETLTKDEDALVEFALTAPMPEFCRKLDELRKARDHANLFLLGSPARLRWVEHWKRISADQRASADAEMTCRLDAALGALGFGAHLVTSLVAVLDDADASSYTKRWALIESRNLAPSACVKFLAPLVDRAKALTSSRELRLRDAAYMALCELLPRNKASVEQLRQLLNAEQNIALRRRLSKYASHAGYRWALVESARIVAKLHAARIEDLLNGRPKEFRRSCLMDVPDEVAKDWPTLLAFLETNLARFEPVFHEDYEFFQWRYTGKPKPVPAQR